MTRTFPVPSTTTLSFLGAIITSKQTNKSKQSSLHLKSKQTNNNKKSHPQPFTFCPLFTPGPAMQNSCPSIAFFQVDPLRSHLLPSFLPLSQLELVIKEKLFVLAPSRHKAPFSKATFPFFAFPLIAVQGSFLCYLGSDKMTKQCLGMCGVLLLTAGSPIPCSIG